MLGREGRLGRKRLRRMIDWRTLVEWGEVVVSGARVPVGRVGPKGAGHVGGGRW
jgi:hypothetical protein